MALREVLKIGKAGVLWKGLEAFAGYQEHCKDWKSSSKSRDTLIDNQEVANNVLLISELLTCL